MASRQNPGGHRTVDEAMHFHALSTCRGCVVARQRVLREKEPFSTIFRGLSGGPMRKYMKHATLFDFGHGGGFPASFQRRSVAMTAFHVTLALTLLGCAFGGWRFASSPDAKQVLMPFEGLRVPPANASLKNNGIGANAFRGKDSFSAQLMTHNTQVSLTTLALGITFGLGTVIVLFTTASF